ncbi:hypothetical protein CC2G_011440 [Coprinopsis cinerea AmutBmut pab1-1]|nr:hypothetical protein CC2G_011440 [Coprinopsis cinerea AmutBmut pab1-1]
MPEPSSPSSHNAPSAQKWEEDHVGEVTANVGCITMRYLSPEGLPPELASDYTSITLQLGRSLERRASVMYRIQNRTQNLEQVMEEFNVINDAIAGDCLAYAAIQNKYETLGYPQVGVEMDGLLDLISDRADMRARANSNDAASPA